jgi:hypothetical protein
MRNVSCEATFDAKRRNKVWVRPCQWSAGGNRSSSGSYADAEQGASHENTLVEEAIFDVTLVTFPVVRSRPTFQAVRKLAVGGRCVACAGWSAPTERRQNAMLV